MDYVNPSEVVAEMVRAAAWVDAWRVFVEPGDVVGIKLNPNGMPRVISAPEVLHAVIDGLSQAGVKPRDIVVFDRNRSFIVRAGYDKWLPEGVPNQPSIGWEHRRSRSRLPAAKSSSPAEGTAAQESSSPVSNTAT